MRHIAPQLPRSMRAPAWSSVARCLCLHALAQVEAFLTQHGLLAANGNGTAAAHQGNGSAAAHAAGNGANVTQYGETATPVSDPKGFFALDEDKVKRFVAERPELAAHVGPPSTASTWTSREVG